MVYGPSIDNIVVIIPQSLCRCQQLISENNLVTMSIVIDRPLKNLYNKLSVATEVYIL